MIKKLLFTVMMLMASVTIFAQTQYDRDLEGQNTDIKRWNLNIRGGYSIGGTLPIGFPAELRHINSYSPKFNYHFGVNIERRFNENWGLQGGLFIDRRGFKSDILMRQFPVILQLQGAEKPIEGPYTGNVVINIIQTGINVPIQASWWASPKVKIAAGPYVFFVMDRSFEGYAYGNKVYDENNNWTGGFDAYLRLKESRGSEVQIGNVYDETNEKGEVTTIDKRGTFGGDDFNHFMRWFQWGVDLTCDYYFAQHWGAFADLSYGFNSAFNDNEGNPVTMGLHPLYFTVGVTYKFGK